MSRSSWCLCAIAVVMLVVSSLTACTSASAGPEEAAASFLRAFAAGDVAAAAAATDQPADAGAALQSARDALKPEAVDADLQQVRITGDTATADFAAAWTLPRSRVWRYEGVLTLSRSENVWSVRWSTADLHPKLAANQSLALRQDDAPTASVLDRDGHPVLVPGTVIKIVLDPTTAGDLTAVANSLSAALLEYDPALTVAAILGGPRAADTAPYVVATLLESDYQAVKSAIYHLPGVSFSARARLLAPDPSFAPTLISQIGKTVEDDLDGKAGWRIVTVSPNGAQIDTLATTPAQPAPAVRLTLDRAVQNSAQAAVNAQTKPAVLVAIRPSTGEILAVAQNAAADASGPIALTGLYPAGSTFKIITATAALQAGAVTAETPSQCPGSTVIGGVRRIPNYNDFDLGTVPLRDAFASSCNTTFAQLSGTLAADALPAAGAQLGVGRDYAISGATTFTGRIPQAADLVKRAEDAIGQGDVQVSPFGMTLAAATVAAGTTPVPTVIQGAPTKVDADPAAVPASVLDQLRLMMRQVVTGGSAQGVDTQGAVFGKTGEAQYGDGTNSHSWFVGYRGDVAFASLIVGGGGSTNAVQMSGGFLARLPNGY